MLRRFPSVSRLALSVAFALALCGCGKKSPSSAETAQSAAPGAGGKKIVHFGNGAEPQDLDPHASTGVPEHQLYNTFFEGLVSQNPQLQTVPGMAERWTISPDGLVYTFHLRADAKWSDGSPVTADDFIQSYKRILNPALGAEYAYMMWHVAGAEDYYRKKITDFAQTGFKAPDARTVQLTLRAPTSFFLSTLSFYPWVPVAKPPPGPGRKTSSATAPTA
jgi:oligopeptide transport system substrate-binding protein